LEASRALYIRAQRYASSSCIPHGPLSEWFLTFRFRRLERTDHPLGTPDLTSVCRASAHGFPTLVRGTPQSSVPHEDVAIPGGESVDLAWPMFQHYRFGPRPTRQGSIRQKAQRSSLTCPWEVVAYAGVSSLAASEQQLSVRGGACSQAASMENNWRQRMGSHSRLEPRDIDAAGPSPACQSPSRNA
jgi:hypothetical protein